MNKSPVTGVSWEWQDILSFSGNLLDETNLREQIHIIKQYLSTRLMAKVSIWLEDTLLPLPDEPGTVAFMSDERTVCMEAAIAKRVLISEEGNNIHCYALGLYSKERLLGALQLETPSSITLDGIEEKLQVFAQQISTGLFYTHQTRIKEWRNKQLELVRSVSAKINQQRNIQKIFRYVTELITGTFHYYFAAVYMFDEKKEKLLYQTSSGKRVSQDPDFRDIFANGIPVGKGLIGTCAQEGRLLHCDDVRKNDAFHYVSGLPETKAEVCIPLKIGNKVKGVLDVQSNFERGFHQNDLRVLQTLADAVAGAVDNAWLLQNIQDQNEKIQTVSEITRALSSILDLDKLLDEVVNIISEKFTYPYVHIFTIDRVMNRVVFRTGTGAISKELKTRGLWFDLESKKGILAYVARKKRVYISDDVLDDDLYLPTNLPPFDPRSELAIPIIYSGQVLGILDIQSTQINDFSEEDAELFRMLSDGIAIALQNALIYRSERWRRKVAESFHEIANIFSRDYSLDEIFRSVLKIASQNLPCSAGVIWHLSGDGSLSVADAIGVDKDELQESLSVEDLDFIISAIDSGEARIRDGVDEIEPLGRKLQLRRSYSAIVAPIINANQKLGAIEIVHENPNRYGQEASAVLKAFAGYTSVAIQNLGLFSASQEQALMATTLLLVSEAAENVESEEDLYSTVSKLIQFVIGVEKVLTYRRERNGEFSLSASVGVENGDADIYRSYPTTFDGILAFSKMLGEEAQDYQSLVIADASGVEQDWIAIPIRVQSKVQGALFVQLDEAMSEYDFLEGSGAKQREVLMAVARQIAIALENLNLRRTEQTEAYVTAVLLQVAEAVVSSSGIDDFLSNVVNILPVLVGVDCVVFLIWDKKRGVFRLANSFCGEWKDEFDDLGEFMQPQDYEPLVKVVEEKEPIYLGLPDLSPASWFKDRNYAILPDKDAVVDTNQHVQLLYPLQDREEFYGVMLVNDSNEQFEYREKRMDILTGVAQQLTLAFQNESLKEEMVGREMLQKEFELAGDIQKAFLPEVIPHVDNWEIGVRWRPARQVGGDFYDFIKLPDGRIGFVIADVSDKGIPAALYMTVTRTLIHATAMENLDPAQALLNVNHQLLESSPQGLFITTLYGILCKETGTFRYANAGHNQPLLIQEALKEVVLLEKGGMPLGVAEDAHIVNRTIEVSKGDTLVLYTDGVTEAQSPDGKLYGMNRLENFLLANLHENMDALLNSLDKNILIFQKGFPPTDDLTAIALHRLQ